MVRSEDGHFLYCYTSLTQVELQPSTRALWNMATICTAHVHYAVS